MFGNAFCAPEFTTTSGADDCSDSLDVAGEFRILDGGERRRFCEEDEDATRDIFEGSWLSAEGVVPDDGGF